MSCGGIEKLLSGDKAIISGTVSAGQAVSFAGSGGVLARLTLLGSYTSGNFALSADTSGGTDVKFA